VILEFGPFVIDSLQRRLFHRTCHVPLAAKPLELLLYLAENPGRIVDKSELLGTVWKGISVSLPNITQTIFVLRSRLRSCDPRPYIVTLPGQGYQFAAVVRKYKDRYISGGKAPGMISAVPSILNNSSAQSARTAAFQLRCHLQQEPRSASAYVAYANSQCLLMSSGQVAPQQALASVQDAVLRALEINPNSGSAYTPLGFLRSHFDRDWTMAERAFHRAIDSRPDDLLAYHWYAELLAARQRFDDSLKILWQAKKMHPQSRLIQTDIAQTLFYAREYRDCEAQLRKIKQNGSNLPVADVLLGCTYRATRRPREAIAILQRVTSQGHRAIALASLAASYALAGEFQRASRILEQLQGMRAKRYIPPYTIAFAAASLGQTTVPLQFLEQAARENDYWILWLRLKAFDSIRKEPRFQRLLQTERLC
jgi:DNA-binding winged helix-turn-helix (wHTH) protein/Flp pilus assembly protein TadD